MHESTPQLSPKQTFSGIKMVARRNKPEIEQGTVGLGTVSSTADARKALVLCTADNSVNLC